VSGGLTVLAILAVAAAGLFVPILGVPGYELAEALALTVGVLGGFAGIAAVKRPGALPLIATLGCALRLCLWLVLAIAVVALRSALASRCDPFRGLPFTLLLPFPSALLAVAIGGLLGTSFPRGRTAGVLYVLVLLSTLAGTLWPIYRGPQVFAFNPLLGWVPGPLYDEDLAVPSSLVWFRALTLVQTLAFLALIPPARGRGAITLVVLCALYAGSAAVEHGIGARASVADLDRALGGRREADGLRIHYPRELTPTRAEQLWRGAALRRAQVADALGIPPDSPLDVFFHRGPEEKGRLTGATRTHFTKPWLGQIHTLVDLDGGGVLRHEMVHALAAPWAPGPFGTSGGVLHFNIALTEGLAEAIDWPADRYTLHQWSKGMRDAGLAPTIASVMTTPGFYGASQNRAYTLAGSFVRYLLDRYGREPLRRAYRSGDLAGAYGKSVAALGEEWGGVLEGPPKQAGLDAAADDRFRQKALFARPCAREAAALRAEAEQARQSEDWLRAAELFGRCSAIDPADAAALEARFQVLQRAGDPALAAQALAALQASPAYDRTQRARVAVALADEAWAAGHLDEAAKQLAVAREAGLPPSADRAALLRQLALGSPDAAALGKALRRYFDGPTGATSLLGLREALENSPDFAPLPYLLGLGLANQGERRWSLQELDGALRLGLPEDFTAQAHRVRATEEIDLAEYQAAELDLAALAAMNRPDAERREADDLASRLAFEKEHFGSAVPGIH
jgi:hypothetical protein